MLQRWHRPNPSNVLGPNAAKERVVAAVVMVSIFQHLGQHLDLAAFVRLEIVGLGASKICPFLQISAGGVMTKKHNQLSDYSRMLLGQCNNLQQLVFPKDAAFLWCPHTFKDFLNKHLQ